MLGGRGNSVITRPPRPQAAPFAPAGHAMHASNRAGHAGRSRHARRQLRRQSTPAALPQDDNNTLNQVRAGHTGGRVTGVLASLRPTLTLAIVAAVQGGLGEFSVR